MSNFFTLIYIKTNQFSDEKFCVGILANINNVPCFNFSKSKLKIALGYVNKDAGKSIKRSLSILKDDVKNVELSIFDLPYSKKILNKLTLKKRGVVQYSELFEITSKVNFDKLYKKFIGENLNIDK